MDMSLVMHTTPGKVTFSIYFRYTFPKPKQYSKRSAAVGYIIMHTVTPTRRLEYIMLLKFLIILSSNSFIFY